VAWLQHRYFALLFISHGYYPKMVFEVRSLQENNKDYLLAPIAEGGNTGDEELLSIFSKSFLSDPSFSRLVSFPRATYDAFAPIEIRLNDAERKMLSRYIK